MKVLFPGLADDRVKLILLFLHGELCSLVIYRDNKGRLNKFSSYTKIHVDLDIGDTWHEKINCLHSYSNNYAFFMYTN